MSIQFVGLKAQFAQLEDEIRAGIDAVLAHGRFIMGPEVAELEQGLAEFAGVEHVVSCASGTDALLMPLMAWEIGPGDAVFTTPFTFVATAEVIVLLGATPVFVDVDPGTFNIDPEKLAAEVGRVAAEGKLRPRAVIPVDLFGLPADYDAIETVAREHDLLVLEDAAQSFGAVYKGRRAGSLGHVAATSFFPAKPLGCYGDGGALLTNDGELADKLRSIRVHGKGSDKYDNVRVGLNARLDTLQAAILLPKLRAFAVELEARQVVAARYTQGLGDVVETPLVPEDCTSAWAQYSVLSDQRDELQSALRDAGVPTAVYYAKPLHLQSAYVSFGYTEGDFPVSEALSRRILSLPMHPYLDEQTQQQVIAAVCKAAAGARQLATAGS